MQKLNVRFSEASKTKIANAAKDYDLTDSMIARAAMNIGLDAINRIISHDPNFYETIERNQKA